MSYPFISLHTSEVVEQALEHLQSADPVMARLIQQKTRFRLSPGRNRFRMLVRSIISQQISTSAARSIRRKLERMLAPKAVIPSVLAATPLAQLRKAGLSNQKAAYIHDLAAKVAARQVRLRRAGFMNDEELIMELTQVKGIGRWTAQMFLIFSLGRPDVFPVDDLGVRMALRNLYGLKDLPNRAEGEQLAAAWKPFSTVASWYCWRSLE
jgi:DNA-3-methyladenine glycosylase II